MEGKDNRKEDPLRVYESLFRSSMVYEGLFRSSMVYMILPYVIKFVKNAEMEETTFGYERLYVWKEGKALTIRVYKITKSFPSEEKFGLISQMRRASSSVCHNLAEGSTRITKKEQARFAEIAFGSLIETASQLDLAKDLGFLDEADHKPLKAKCVNLGRLISRYRKAILNRKDI